MNKLHSREVFPRLEMCLPVQQPRPEDGTCLGLNLLTKGGVEELK